MRTRTNEAWSFAAMRIQLRIKRRRRRQSGAVIVLAMMFLVIFASLAASMAIIAQGNLTTADTHLKMNRALAASETGVRFISYRINQASQAVTTRAGKIDSTNAPDLWEALRDQLIADMTGELHLGAAPAVVDGTLVIGPVSLGPSAPTFTAYLTPHPIAGENYGSDYYKTPPYSTMTPAVSALNPLDTTWVRLKVVATDGRVDANDPNDTKHRRVSRSISMDYKLDKKIRYAILSKSRVMIGQNVMIDGEIGSRFIETHLTHGHPVQMVSDFRNLSADLDADLVLLRNTLGEKIDPSDPTVNRDVDGDNRINLNHPVESADIVNAAAMDRNGDGYIDDYDFFLKWYDTNADGAVTALELDTASNVSRAQLLELIDTFGDATRQGYNDGVIDDYDRYAKIRGNVQLTATMEAWEDGAAGGEYHDYFTGPIHPKFGTDPLTFGATSVTEHQFESTDFSAAVTAMKAVATGDLVAQAVAQAASNDPDDPTSPQPIGANVLEAVPFGSAYPYDYYNRPVFENMTFENVTIPKGTNALFKNCVFKGVTFIDTTVTNTDANFNYSGMLEADGVTEKHPDRDVTIAGVTIHDTKSIANNIRFQGCTFEGSIVSEASEEFTHVRNKVSFTGVTKFKSNEAWMTDEQKDLYKRSTILMPHYSVEMGTFVSPADSNETVNLSGTIVAGVLDMRGQVKVQGTILTTFEPVSNTGPVMGDTSPQFNTTLGYFASADGDLETELPANGIGVIQVRYDPTIPLPDGILGPVELRPVVSTYREGGK
jgi:hypothetical protein